MRHLIRSRFICAGRALASLCNWPAPAQILLQAGDNVMIGGFIVPNTGVPTSVIVRAIGPSLTGVPNALADPTLELDDSNGALVASNDNWNNTQKTEIIASTVAD